MNSSEESLKFLTSNWEGIVALCALFITVLQTWGMHRHNRLSVRPHLATWAYQDNSDGHYKAGIELLNNGLGPAILKRFRVYFDGKEIGDNFDKLALESKIEQILENEPGIMRHTISIIGLDFPAPSNYKETLLEIQVPTHTQFSKKPYQDFLNRFNAELSYQSMYGQKFFYHSYSADDLKSWPLKVRLFIMSLGIQL